MHLDQVTYQLLMECIKYSITDKDRQNDNFDHGLDIEIDNVYNTRHNTLQNSVVASQQKSNTNQNIKNDKTTQNEIELLSHTGNSKNQEGIQVNISIQQMQLFLNDKISLIPLFRVMIQQLKIQYFDNQSTQQLNVMIQKLNGSNFKKYHDKKDDMYFIQEQFLVGQIFSPIEYKFKTQQEMQDTQNYLQQFPVDSPLLQIADNVKFKQTICDTSEYVDKDFFIQLSNISINIKHPQYAQLVQFFQNDQKQENSQ